MDLDASVVVVSFSALATASGDSLSLPIRDLKTAEITCSFSNLSSILANSLLWEINYYLRISAWVLELLVLKVFRSSYSKDSDWLLPELLGVGILFICVLVT